MKGTARSLGERAGYTGTLVLLVVVALACSALGKWQLDRGAAQRSLRARAEMAQTKPPLDLATRPMAERDLFRRASAEGMYDPTQQFYLAGRSLRERPGYHVITALRLAGTRRYLLVNRGWMSADMTVAPVPGGRVRVQGVLARAQVPALLLGEPQGAVRPYLDPTAYGEESGREVEPLILMASGEGSTLVPVTPVNATREGMHLGYALQWFAFSAIAGGAALVILARRWRHAP